MIELLQILSWGLVMAGCFIGLFDNSSALFREYNLDLKGLNQIRMSVSRKEIKRKITNTNDEELKAKLIKVLKIKQRSINLVITGFFSFIILLVIEVVFLT